jgi:L-ascorbate metabolism protein UlaG (beta-lactamase superfamily)
VRSASTVVVAPEVVRSGVSGAGGLANGQTKRVGGVMLEAVPMYNDTTHPEMGMAEPFHTRGRGNGYIVTLDGVRIYIAGDTSCTPELKALKAVDVAFLPMNLPFTMSPEDAAACARAFRPAIVYPYHYLGRDLGAPSVFAKAMQGSGIDVRIRDWYVGVPIPR